MERSPTTVWETPFTHAQYPSVGLVIEPDGEGTALLFVAPGGLDEYPKYLVRFTHVLSVTCSEEAGSLLELGQECCPRDVIAYVWDASPHSAAYRSTVLGANLSILHYVILGGDNIVSVVCGSTPSIETIDSPTELAVRYAV